MPNTPNLYGKKRGPVPVFTVQAEVRIRPDTVASLERIARALRLTRSDVMRLALDQFVSAFESESRVLTRLEEVKVSGE